MASPQDERPRPTPSAFGRLLRRLRAAADLTQEELAERAGVSARLVSDLERGTIQRPRRSTVEMLSDALRLDGDERARFAETARPRQAAGQDDAAPERAEPASGALVGRERELAATIGLLGQPATRMLTLTGPGGVGKTRLALEIAARAADAFPDGVVSVDLAPVGEVARVVPAIATALRLRDQGDVPLATLLVETLRDKRLLLVLDNLEHLTGAAPDIARLIDTCPRLAVLGTSRRPLRLRGEHEYPLAPLGLPDLSDLPALEELRRIPAVELFARRAEVARPSFALTERNALDVAAIVTRLEGLPLAIELAAARIRLLAPADLLARLDQRLPLLSGRDADAPERQRTMRAAIDWSYDLLDAHERSLYRRLAVFAGGFTLDAAEEICAPDGGHSAASRVDVLDIITTLVDHSLLRLLDPPDADGDVAPRFSMLETIREHGLGRLAEAGEEGDARRRHAAWALDLAERALPGLHGPEQRAWYERLESEHDNIRAALRWAIERDEAEVALRLAGALYRFWVNCGYLVEGRDWMAAALAIENAAEFPAARAEALLGDGVFAWFLGDYDGAAARTESALEGFRELGDLAGVASSLGNLGMIADVREDYPRARSLYEEALGLFRILNDRTRTGYMISNLALIAYFERDYERAVALSEEGLELFRALGDEESIAILLGNLGLVAFAQQDYERAASLQGEALGLQIQRNPSRVARNLENVALIAAATGDPALAMRLFGAAETQRERVGAALPPNDAELYGVYIDAARAELGEAAFATAWSDGASMPLDAAIDYALEAIPAARPAETLRTRS